MVGVSINQCPIVRLGEIGTFENGTGMPKRLFIENGGTGAIHYGHIYTTYDMFVTNPIVYIDKEVAGRLKKVNPGDLVIAKTSENIEDIMKTIAYLGEEVAVTGGHAAIFRHEQNPKFLAYMLNGSNKCIKQKNKMAQGVKVKDISTTDMARIEIPLPPLEIQQEIVTILDKFHAITTDLQQGLPKLIEQEQKRYEYYRERLLSFPKTPRS